MLNCKNNSIELKIKFYVKKIINVPIAQQPSKLIEISNEIKNKK